VEAVILYCSLFSFALSGIMLTGAINHYKQSKRLMEDTRALAMRVLLRARRS
jgi:hypothetical protein